MQSFPATYDFTLDSPKTRALEIFQALLENNTPAMYYFRISDALNLLVTSCRSVESC